MTIDGSRPRRARRTEGHWPPLAQVARSAPAAAVAQQLWDWAMAETNETGPTGYPRWIREQLPLAASGRFSPTVVAGLLAVAGQNTVDAPARHLEPFAASPSRTVRLALAKNLPLAVRSSDESQAVAILERLAEDPSPIVRDWAICGLGRQLFALRDRRMAAVFKGLTDPSARVRSEARHGVREFNWSMSGDDWEKDISHLVPGSD